MDYFTSDSHYSHRKIVIYCKRLEFASAEERKVIERGDPEELAQLRISDATIQRMDEAMISRWNSRVTANDTVYHLGDFSFGPVMEILRRLNGKVIFCEGNHDKNLKQVASQLKAPIHRLLEVTIQQRRVVLCHYAMRTWPGKNKSSYHLYGHSHGELPDDPQSYSFDVGVDCHNFYPISFEEVTRIMNKKQVVLSSRNTT